MSRRSFRGDPEDEDAVAARRGDRGQRRPGLVRRRPVPAHRGVPVSGGSGASTAEGVVVCRPRSVEELEEGLSVAATDGTEVFVLVSSVRVYGADPAPRHAAGGGTPPSPGTSRTRRWRRSPRPTAGAARRPSGGDGPRVVVLRPCTCSAPAPRAHWPPSCRRLGCGPGSGSIRCAGRAHRRPRRWRSTSRSRSWLSGPFNVAGRRRPSPVGARRRRRGLTTHRAHGRCWWIWRRGSGST